jgi:hypothetical protein
MIVKSLDDGHEIPADIGAKAVHVTVDTIEDKAYENVQDALQQLVNTDSILQANIVALEEKRLYTAGADVVAITEDTTLNLSEETYKYILIYCEYNGKRMPVYQVLADGASSEVIYHSLTDDGVCYIGMNMLVSKNTLAISNVINSNDTAEFKILNIYGCV